MKMNKPLTRILTAIILAVGILSAGVTTAAKGLITDSGQDASNILNKFQGNYLEVNNKCNSNIVSIFLEDGYFFVTIRSYYEVWFQYGGEVQNVKKIDNGISFDCFLNPFDGSEVIENIPAHIMLTQMPSGLYDFQMNLQGEPNQNLAQIVTPMSLYRMNNDRIAGAVPAKISDKVTIASLIKAITPYFFEPEMMTTRMYLRDRTGLSDTEVVRQDERNRYLEYAWGDLNKCMECKYWITKDDNVLLIVNIHDATYEFPQRFRFFLFNKDNGTMRELPTAMSDKWPLNEYGNNGICYQVRYSSDGIIALVPQTNGDSFDVVTLKFDGETFR